ELNLEHPRLAGLAPAAALDAFLLGSAPGAVRSVWVAGRPVVEDGRHPLRDAAERRFRSAMKQWTVEG
ncbi:MAG: formimidoylglutamate deiminase, partial [Myxococcota bacterium]